MGFTFKSAEEKIALTEADETIHMLLKAVCQTNFNKSPSHPKYLSEGSIRVDPILDSPYEQRPHTLPFTTKDIQDFIDTGLEAFGEGYFSVWWHGNINAGHDTVYRDDFRSVIHFRTIEVMLRPSASGDDENVRRIHFCPSDVKDCLRETLNAALKQNPNDSTMAVVGKGSVMHPSPIRHRGDAYYGPRIPFEWRVDRIDKELLDKRVKKWRHKASGGYDGFHARSNEYSKFVRYLTYVNHPGITGTNVDAVSSDERRWASANKVAIPRLTTSKRPSGEMGASQALDPRSKRRSMISQASSGSQWEPDLPSDVSSPEIPGPPSLSGASMGPTAWGSRGSRGGFGADSSHIASTMADLRVGSPNLTSTGNVPPPPEGPSWCGRQGMGGWTAPGFGGGCAPQNRIPGYQGPGHAQPTEVYGHLRYDLQGPPQNIQQSPQYPGRHAPPPGQQRLPPEQAAAQLSHQHRRMGDWAPQAGSGYVGDFRPNVAAPGRGPNIQHMRNYPRSFPPVQSVMHGGGDRLPEPGEQDSRSWYPGVLRTGSPEPLDLTPDLFGEGNIRSSFPPHALHMSQSSELPPMPPPSMRGIGPPHFQPPTRLGPGGENYPFSSAPSLPYMTAAMSQQPESEDVLEDPDSDVNDDDDDDDDDEEAESGSVIDDYEDNAPIYTEDITIFQPEWDSRGEDEQLRNLDVAVRQTPQHPCGQEPDSESESESDGENEQPAYTNTPVSRHLQYTGGQDDGRLYHSPSPIRGTQPGNSEGPMWGAIEPERNETKGNEPKGNEPKGNEPKGNEPEGDYFEETDSEGDESEEDEFGEY